jgi:hypothetical protein
MSRAAIDEYVQLLDEAFEGESEHSLLRNLATVTEDDWLWLPPHGARTIRTLMGHLGGMLWLYHDRAFGNYEDFGDPIVSWNHQVGNLGVRINELDGLERLEHEPGMTDLVAWVTERHRIFRDAVAALEGDAALREERIDHHGAARALRWFIATMLQHTLYHAGEINHIRALRQGDDGGWRTASESARSVS